MTAPTQTWKSYGQLLARLLPAIGHSLLASADGRVLWCSEDAQARAAPTLAKLLDGPATCRSSEIDGIADTPESRGPQFGFRIRGALGEVLGFVVVALPPGPGERRTLASVHAQIKPALDCLQSELAARAASGELHANPADSGRDEQLFRRLSGARPAGDADALDQIPALALEHLHGVVATLLVPARNLTLSCSQPGQLHGMDADLLAQVHHHLLTRAQLHGCTLAANKLSLDGSKTALPFKAISTPLRDEVRRVIGALLVFRRDSDDDFQLRDAETLEMLARRAGQIVQTSFDRTTGMLTPCAFIAQAGAKLADGDRARPLALLYVDIDQLNVVNDNHGMHVGDEMIQCVANLMCRRARPGTLVARMAGDRFVMLLPGCGIEPAARIAEELRAAAVNLGGVRGDRPLLVSLSIGVTRIGDRAPRLELAMAAAEAACKTAKDRGRNRVEVFHVSDKGAGNQATAGIVAQITAALGAGSFELLAQPLLPLLPLPADPRFEIAVRMRAADGTCLSLDKLVSAAASPDITRGVDRWVIEQTLNRLARCRDILRIHPANFTLRVSAASLADAEFWRILEQLVHAARLEPGTVTFEFPEAAASAQINRIVPCMERLRGLGVRFALENFGRGVSSLSNLNLLPVSCIKIDGSFSRDLTYNPSSQSMVLAITKLAAAFGIETIAPNIETDAIRARAAELGVDYGQGFFIGKPLPLDDVIRDLPLYSCFATSTGRFEAVPASPVALAKPAVLAKPVALASPAALAG